MRGKKLANIIKSVKETITCHSILMRTEHHHDIDPDVMVMIVKPQIPAATGGGPTETAAALEAVPPVNKERNPETPPCDS